MKTQLKMFRGDITTVEVDAIVNSANNDLVLGGGVSGAIRRVAGPGVQEECHKIGTIPLGTAVVTTGGQLRVPWIIHAAVNPLGLWADAKSVRSATRAALLKAEEKQVKRLAFPAIGTGAGALAVERCADILIEEVMKHCASDQTALEEVLFVLYDEKPFAIFEERYKQKVLGEPPSPEPAYTAAESTRAGKSGKIGYAAKEPPAARPSPSFAPRSPASEDKPEGKPPPPPRIEVPPVPPPPPPAPLPPPPAAPPVQDPPGPA